MEDSGIKDVLHRLASTMSQKTSKATSTVCPHCGTIINHDNDNRIRYFDELPSPHTRGASEAVATLQRDVEALYARPNRGT